MGTRKNKITVLFVLLLLFSISVIVRLPALNRPLSYHHEWLTAHALVNLQIWYEDGILTHRFLPIVSYNNTADKYIGGIGRVSDANGNKYYTSYPPFSFILPYLILSALSIRPDVLPLQAFNLFLHFINCALIYALVESLTKKEHTGTINPAAMVAFSVYLFSMATLWYHSNTYFPDMLVQTFFISGIYLAHKHMTSRDDRKYLFLFGINMFLMTETEWLSGFFVVSLLVYTLIDRKNKRVRRLFYVAAAASLFALILTVLQYSQINGFESYASSFAKKLTQRSGIATEEPVNLYTLEAVERILTHYKNSYWPFLAVFAIFGIILLKRRKTSDPSKIVSEIKADHREEFFVCYLALLPCLLHHIFGLDLTYIHEFTALKTGVFISILMALLYASVTNTGKPQDNRRMAHIANALIMLASIISIMLYVNTNIDTYSAEQISKYQVIGETISNEAMKDEVVFLRKNITIQTPQIMFYSHRNVAIWSDDESARELIAMNNATRGVVFVLNDTYDVEQKYYFNP